MSTTSITSPGTLPATSLDDAHPTLDSLVDVWVAALRRGDDPAVVVEDMWRWAT